MNRLVILLRTSFLAVFLMLVALPSFATCSGGGNGSATINLPSQLPTIRDAAVGTVLYDSGWAVMSSSVPVSGCSGSLTGSAVLTTSGTPVSGNYVYATSIPGIGIAVFSSIDNGPSLTGNPSVVSVSNDGSATTATQCTNNCSGLRYFRVQLVITGPITTGSMSYSGVYATAYWSGSQVGTLTLNGTTTAVAPTCTVQTSAIAVNLPSLSTGAFPSVGATAGNTPFNIVLNCSSASQVGIVLTDANLSTNMSTNLRLQAGGASGIAVRVLRNGNPLNLGQAGPLVNSGGPIRAINALGTSPTGTWTIPFEAQYVRTGAVSAGAVVAQAIFTMTYQ